MHREQVWVPPESQRRSQGSGPWPPLADEHFPASEALGGGGKCADLFGAFPLVSALAAQRHAGSIRHRLAGRRPGRSALGPADGGPGGVPSRVLSPPLSSTSQPGSILGDPSRRRLCPQPRLPGASPAAPRARAPLATPRQDRKDRTGRLVLLPRRFRRALGLSWPPLLAEAARAEVGFSGPGRARGWCLSGGVCPREPPPPVSCGGSAGVRACFLGEPEGYEGYVKTLQLPVV